MVSVYSGEFLENCFGGVQRDGKFVVGETKDCFASDFALIVVVLEYY